MQRRNSALQNTRAVDHHFIATALVTIGMTKEEVWVKASDAGKPEAEIEKEMAKFKEKKTYIDRTGKIVWQTPD